MTRTQSLIPVLEIGGTHVTAALVAMDEALPFVVNQHRVSIDSSASADVLIGEFAASGHAIDDIPNRALWGVAIPGPFDYQTGVAEFTGVGKFDALYGVDLGAELQRELAPHVAGMSFVNDATAFALGECAAGAGRHHRRVICLTLGTGVGSAFIADGRAVGSGPTVPKNGWAYLLEWGGKPLEETVSRRAIRAAYQRVTGQTLDVHEIADLARHGDRGAAEILDRAMTALGEAIGPWVAAFGATSVVVGGSIAGSWDLLAEPLRKSLMAASGVDELDVSEALLGDDAALIGAAEAAVNALFDADLRNH